MLNIFLGLVGVGVAIAGIAVAVNVSRRKVIRYAYECERVVYLDSGIRESVEAKYMGVTIEGSVDRVKVRLCNSGNREIRENDFVGTLKIDIGESGRVLEHTLDEVADGLEVHAALHERGVEVKFGALNPKESILMTMLLSKWNGEIEVKGRILGAKVARYPSGTVWKTRILMAFIPISITGIVVMSMGHWGLGFILVLTAGAVNLMLGITSSENIGELLRVVCNLPKI